MAHQAKFIAFTAIIVLAAPAYAHICDDPLNPCDPYDRMSASERQQYSKGGRPVEPVAFPDIKDWNSLRVTLSRGSCEGVCAIYEVEVRGDGAVIYNGYGYVTIEGHHESKIDEGSIRKLIGDMRAAQFFWSYPAYILQATDLPQYKVSVKFDDKSWSITDYRGEEIGMPPELKALEDKIDTIADTARWVTFSSKTLSTLEHENYFQHISPDDAMLTRLILNGADTNLVLQLAARGMPIDVEDQRVSATPLLLASYFGNAKLTEYLLSKGARKNFCSWNSTNALDTAVMGQREPSANVKNPDYGKTIKLLKQSGLKEGTCPDYPKKSD